MGAGISSTSNEDHSSESDSEPHVLKSPTIKYLEKKTRLSREEIFSWHQRFLVIQSSLIPLFFSLKETYPFKNLNASNTFRNVYYENKLKNLS